MGRVVVIGIDGMDYKFIKANLPALHNCSKFFENGYLGPLKSIFPADSIPAWVTVFTGMGPDEHGIIQSIDYLKKDFKSFAVDTSVFRGKTFWDTASNQGKKVCIINPFLAYPVWAVNGVMISGPVFISGDIKGYPADILEKYQNMAPMGGIVDFPTKKTLAHFVEKTSTDTDQLAQFSLELFKRERWDLFFVSFFTLDRLQHFLWRYCDEQDPTYPGVTHHRYAILDLYKQFDKILGDFFQLLRPGDTLLALSDHGHGMRCTKLLNLNEFLRRKGYLHSGRAIPFLSKVYWVEKAKNNVLHLLYRLRMEEYSYLLAKFVRNPKSLKTSAYAISDDASIARLADFAGMGPFGGISINSAIRQGQGYKKIRECIIKDLTDLNRENNMNLFKWIKRRDEEYSGVNVSVYPDILFELCDGIGVNWGLFMPLIINNPFHRRISGGHNTDGVLTANRSDFLDDRKGYSLKDVHGLVLKALGSEF